MTEGSWWAWPFLLVSCAGRSLLVSAISFCVVGSLVTFARSCSRGAWGTRGLPSQAWAPVQCGLRLLLLWGLGVEPRPLGRRQLFPSVAHSHPSAAAPSPVAEPLLLSAVGVVSLSLLVSSAWRLVSKGQRLSQSPAPGVQGIGRGRASDCLVWGIHVWFVVAVVTRPLYFPHCCDPWGSANKCSLALPTIVLLQPQPPQLPGPLEVSGTPVQERGPAFAHWLRWAAHRGVQGTARTGLRLPSHPCCFAGGGRGGG